MIASREPAQISLDQYVPLLGAAEIEELRTLARPLEGAVVDMVNSTAVGGGVAEILTRLLPLARELGLDARWHVMEGGPEFYDITKSFHNALHGNAYDIRPRDFEIFLDYNRRNRERMALDGQFVVIHDPQSSRPGSGVAISIFHAPIPPCGTSWSRLSPAMTAPFSHRPNSRGSYRFLNICFIPLSIRCRKRTAISIRISSKMW